MPERRLQSYTVYSSANVKVHVHHSPRPSKALCNKWHICLVASTEALLDSIIDIYDSIHPPPDKPVLAQPDVGSRGIRKWPPKLVKVVFSR